MYRILLIALIAPFVSEAVNFSEKAKGKTGAEKRTLALDFVKNRLIDLGMQLGELGSPDDSLILGSIDAAVHSYHREGIFGAHKTDVRSYQDEAPKAPVVKKR